MAELLTLRVLIGLALATVVAAIGAAAVQLWRARRRWQRRIAHIKRTDYTYNPVVLVHGILGFDQLRLGWMRHAYFRGVAELMDAVGAQIHLPRVGPLSTVRSRAAQLAAHIAALPAPRVNLIAHSMGGLDARYAISKLGLAERVGALITIGTPHHGTALANIGGAVIRRVPWIPLGVLSDLSERGMQLFNEAVPDAPGVFYGSVVAHGDLRSLHVLLLPTFVYIWRREGANDGLIAARSQRWGEVVAEVEADHWAQIGWSARFDAPALFERILAALAERGL